MKEIVLVLLIIICGVFTAIFVQPKSCDRVKELKLKPEYMFLLKLHEIQVLDKMEIIMVSGYQFNAREIKQTDSIFTEWMERE